MVMIGRGFHRRRFMNTCNMAASVTHSSLGFFILSFPSSCHSFSTAFPGLAFHIRLGSHSFSVLLYEFFFVSWQIPVSSDNIFSHP